jgi:hypothetical protein
MLELSEHDFREFQTISLNNHVCYTKKPLDISI